jgi:outer membrane protein OmpA-like peptidoglycan-associated protein
MPTVLLALLSPAIAADVDPFTEASSLAVGRGGLQGEAPQLTDEGSSASASVGLLQAPVVRTFDDRPSQIEVDGLVPVTLHAGYTVENGARFDVFLPLYAWVGAPLTGYDGAAFGDARVQSTVPLWVSETMAFAVVPRLHLPTGNADALVGGGFGGGLLASLGGDNDDVGWVANAGVTLRGARQLEMDAPGLGSTLDATLSGWWHAAPGLRLGAELDLDGGLARGEGDGGRNATGLAHLFGQAMLGKGIGLVAGAGTGVVQGIGTPQAHGFVSLTYGQLQRDTDGDGLVDAVDACPGDPEDLDGFDDTDGCPDLDNDADRILDIADQCALEPEDPDGFADDDGCPDPDNDGDGLLDGADACPDDAGPAELNGCPDTDGDGLADSADACPTEAGPEVTGGCPDRDEDLVPDHRDACPDEPKPPGEDPATSDGCPKTVFVGDGEITITERIEFETGSAVLLPVSTPILEQVAKVLSDHPEIELLEIQGHTDNVGSTSYNIKLSDQRAKSVLAWLVDKGIEPTRLAATGYGEGLPIASNRTPKGRETNRRVQFKILRSTATAAPPPPAPAPKAVPTPAPAPAPEPKEPVIDDSDIESPWGVQEAPEEEESSPWGAAEPGEAPEGSDESPWTAPDPAPDTAPSEEAEPEEAKRPPRRSKKR